jgi:hypothetical protein
VDRSRTGYKLLPGSKKKVNHFYENRTEFEMITLHAHDLISPGNEIPK